MSYITRWESYQRGANISRQTIELRRYHIDRIEPDTECSVLELSLDDLLLVVGNPDWSPATRRSYRATLRAFFSWAVAGGLVSESPAHKLPPVRVPRGMPRPATDAEYAAAMMAADERQMLELRLGNDCGLRRAEIARVRPEDVTGDLTGWSLRVTGKGGHVRVVPMPDDLAQLVLAAGPGWVFPSPHRATHLTPAHLGKIVSRLFPDGVATHVLRHRAGARAYAGTRDLRAVQEFLGHAKPETTAIYTQVPAASIRAVMQAAAA
ncbi:tyrosine-type recombinase/integrase [Aeromicrobium sp. YIM 150415]|uniref:tyrosine-type recombinase/integrase n=1 Tax=Aeromicrobium sp. YIM 150415 TaxID=2803912 RepID=UPI001962A001|nr:tyrosine-type recombinase/integrase [Aeromicrobium sp. YIM 150415]MBM9464661.1 tyrosine-type recombinase/integrase [Aeromicrobium sp. YIM 150415]